MSRFLLIADQNAAPADITNLTNVIQNGGGHILQSWENSVLIGEGSALTQNDLSQQPSVALITDGLAVNPGALNITDVAAAVASGWNLLQSPPQSTAWTDYLNGVLPTDGLLPSNGCGAEPQPAIAPVLLPTQLSGLLGIPANNAIATPVVHHNRRALVNTIGVAILEIDGKPGTSAAFQQFEREIAIQAISQGFRILENLAPSKAHLVFDVKVRRTQIDVDPATLPGAPANPNSPTSSEYENIEKKWRDPALTKLGASTGRTGFRDIVQSSNFLFTIDWGFVVVMTKYRAAFQGYAPNYRDVVISYSMIPNILVLPAIVAHEIGHTVGAFDEYQPDCRITHLCGFTNTPNLNCEFLNPFSIDCLMKNNKPIVCGATRAHFGWGDHDLDGVLDPFDQDFPAI